MKRVYVIGKTVGVILLMAGVCRGSVNATISWNPSLLDVDGQVLSPAADYKLFYSNTSGVHSAFVDAGSSTMATVTGLEYNKTYYFKAKAYTSTGESGFSEEFTWKTPAMPDVDADDLSDSWEMEHFNRLDLAQNLTDSDGDGSTDLNEFLAGTNPVDPDEYPVVEIRPSASGAKVAFEARQAAGDGYENRSRSYTLMQCDDLAAGIWTSVPGLENILAANQMVNWDVASTGRSGFFRTEIQLD